MPGSQAAEGVCLLTNRDGLGVSGFRTARDVLDGVRNLGQVAVCSHEWHPSPIEPVIVLFQILVSQDDAALPVRKRLSELIILEDLDR